MYEFEIFHPEIKKSRIIFGYTYADACRRANVSNPEEWSIEYAIYVD